MIEIIINQFKDLTTLEWIGQICGYIAFIIYVISTQLSKKRFLFLSLFVFTFFALEQIFAKLYGGIITNIFCLIRSTILLIELKHNKEKMPEWLNYLLIILLWLISIIIFIYDPNFFKGTVNCFLPLILATVFAATLNNKNYAITKIGLFINEFGYLCYFIYNKLPLSYLREFILLAAIAHSTVREFVKQKRVGN